MVSQRAPVVDPSEVQRETLLNLLPGRQDIATALLGALFAAPRRQPELSHLGIVGAPRTSMTSSSTAPEHEEPSPVSSMQRPRRRQR